MLRSYHSALRLVGQEPEPSQATDMALACCFLGQVLGVGCHYFPPALRHSNLRRQVPPRLHDARDPSGERSKYGREYCPVNLAEMTTTAPFGGSFTCRKLRHGTDGFTSPPKERVIEGFFVLKIRRLRPGLNPRTRVPEASTRKLLRVHIKELTEHSIPHYNS